MIKNKSYPHTRTRKGLNDLISLDKGCYLGQEAMAKISSKRVIKNKLCFWKTKR